MMMFVVIGIVQVSVGSWVVVVVSIVLVGNMSVLSVIQIEKYFVFVMMMSQVDCVVVVGLMCWWQYQSIGVSMGSIIVIVIVFYILVNVVNVCLVFWLYGCSQVVEVIQLLVIGLLFIVVIDVCWVSVVVVVIVNMVVIVVLNVCGLVVVLLVVVCIIVCFFLWLVCLVVCVFIVMVLLWVGFVVFVWCVVELLVYFLQFVEVVCVG